MKRYNLEVKDFINNDLEVTVFGEGKPEVLITGGIHGGEVTGIYAAKRLMEYLESNDLLKGSVKIISVCNPTAFRRMERSSPYDNLDMNRIFPGDQYGTLSQRVANVIWHESQTADYIVDLHCCGVWGYSYTLAVWKDYDYAKELAALLDIPLIIQSGGTRGQLFVETCVSGRPAIIIELPGGGQAGVIDKEAGDNAFNALKGMLIQLNMLAGEFAKPNPQWCDKLIPQRAEIEGLFTPYTKAGDVVNAGQVLGTIDGIELKAPKKGTLTAMRPMGYVFVGTYVGNLAPHIE